MSQYLTKVHVFRDAREMDGQPALVYTGKVYDAELVRVTEGSILNNDAIVAQTRPFNTADEAHRAVQNLVNSLICKPSGLLKGFAKRAA